MSKKVFAFAIRKSKYELCPSDLFDKSVVITKDHKSVFEKSSKKLWEYFHKQLKACKKDSKSEDFYINGKLINVVYGSGITAEELNEKLKAKVKKTPIKQVKTTKAKTNSKTITNQAQQFLDFIENWNKTSCKDFWDWTGDFNHITECYDDEGTENCIYEILATQVLKLCSKGQYNNRSGRAIEGQIDRQFNIKTIGHASDGISYLDANNNLIEKTDDYDLPIPFGDNFEPDFDDIQDCYYLLFNDDSLILIPDHDWRGISKDEIEIKFPNSINNKNANSLNSSSNSKVKSKTNQYSIEVGYFFSEETPNENYPQYIGSDLLDCLEQFINTEYQNNPDDLLDNIKNAKANGVSRDNIANNIILEDFDHLEDEFYVHYVKELNTGNYLYGGDPNGNNSNSGNNPIPLPPVSKKPTVDPKLELDFIVNRMKENLNTIDKWIKPQYLEMTKHIIKHYPDISDKQKKAIYAANGELTKWFKSFTDKPLELKVDIGDDKFTVKGSLVECIDQIEEKLPGYSKLMHDMNRNQKDDTHYVIDSLNSYIDKGFKSIKDQYGNQYLIQGD